MYNSALFHALFSYNNDYEKFRYNPDSYINATDGDNSGNNSNLTVYFRQGRNNIDLSYRDNSYSLNRFLTAVKELQNSTDSHVTKVLIAGFASPEGTAELNARLGQTRAETTRRYLIENGMLGAGQIELYNGRVNWTGLRKLVAQSNMPYREQVLNIIDNTPDSRRQAELMRLGGGEPYRYMLNNLFPELRNATYIKVYYENK